jgi:Uma2 family endonuclease
MAPDSPAYTPEDLLTITDRPMPELVGGQLVERAMGEESDLIATRILLIVGQFVSEHRLGWVHGSQCGYQIFPDDPRKVRIPDVSFTRTERLPPGGPAKGHARVAPDLVVEVISPNDLAADLIARLEDYHAAGVPLLWVVDPATRSVRVERGDGTAARLGPAATIDGGAVLPGFSRVVADFFES